MDDCYEKLNEWTKGWKNDWIGKGLINGWMNKTNWWIDE